MENPSSQQRRGRNNQKRARVSVAESGNASNSVEPIFSDGPSFATAAHSHRANAADSHTVTQGFASYARAPHHSIAAASEGLMNGYSAPHSQYPEQPALLAPVVQSDGSTVTGLNGLGAGIHQVSHPGHAPGQQPDHHNHYSHQSAPPPQSHVVHHQQQPRPQQQPTPQLVQQRPNAASVATTDRVLFQTYTNSSTADPSNNLTPTSTPTPTPTPASAYNANGAAAVGLSNWSATPAPPMTRPSPAPSATTTMAAPPERIYPSFEELLADVQKVAKEQGYGIVKLRSSNYREGKPTRYDLVCDRGGVKYNSTAKKRNPSTRKIDCPWRGKAVCEVQLGYQWRFAVQEARHNHEARVAASAPPPPPPPVDNSNHVSGFRHMSSKLDSLYATLMEGFGRLESSVNQRLDNMEKRLDSMETVSRPSMLGPNGPPNIGTPSMGTSNMVTPSMPTTNMGGSLSNTAMGNGMGSDPMGNGPMGNGPMGNGTMGNGSMGPGGMHGLDARVTSMDQQRGMGVGGMNIIDDDTRNLGMSIGL